MDATRYCPHLALALGQLSLPTLLAARLAIKEAPRSPLFGAHREVLAAHGALLVAGEHLAARGEALERELFEPAAREEECWPILSEVALAAAAFAAALKPAPRRGASAAEREIRAALRDLAEAVLPGRYERFLPAPRDQRSQLGLFLARAAALDLGELGGPAIYWHLARLRRGHRALGRLLPPARGGDDIFDAVRRFEAALLALDAALTRHHPRELRRWAALFSPLTRGLEEEARDRDAARRAARGGRRVEVP